jgi:transcriptional regulator with XRE-family HTH domain
MKKKSLRQQAIELQISPSYLSMILSGQRQPNPRLRDKMCSLGMFTDKADLSLRGRCPRPLDECATLAGHRDIYRTLYALT